MTTLMIRNVDPSTKERLRVRAARAGRSMEAEMRVILTEAVEPEEELNLAEAIRRRFGPLGGVDDLQIPPREPARNPPDFNTPDFDR